MTKSNKDKIVYSRSARDSVFTVYEKPLSSDVAGNRVLVRKVVIKGGVGVAWHGGENEKKYTKQTATRVSSSDLELLEKSPAFKRMVKNGFMVVGDKSNTEVIDKSSQLNIDNVKDKVPGVEVLSASEAKELGGD